MKRRLTILAGISLAVAIGVGAGALDGAADSPQLGGLTPLAPQGATDSSSTDQALFIDDEPETPFIDGPGGSG